MSTLIATVNKVPSAARTLSVLGAATGLTVAVMLGLNSIVGRWS